MVNKVAYEGLHAISLLAQKNIRKHNIHVSVWLGIDMIENSCTALAESKMDSWNLSNVLTSIQGSSISGDDIHSKHFNTCYNMEMVVVGNSPPVVALMCGYALSVM